MSFREFIDRLRGYTGMYIPREEYLLVCMFVAGYNCALDGIPLRGFREWLALREGKGANLMWYELARESSLKDLRHVDAPGGPNSDCSINERLLIDSMLDLLLEFLNQADSNGIEDVLASYMAKFGKS